MTVIIHGPQGCGKTSAAPAFARRFGCPIILDDDSAWDGRSELPPNALVLLSEKPAPGTPLPHGTRIMDFFDALRSL